MNGTRENIINALFIIASQEPDKTQITISEIAEVAGISRQAIYQKHFNSVDEIFSYVHTKIDNEIFDAYRTEVLPNLDKISIYQGIAEELLPLIYKHRDWLRVLYHTRIDPYFVDFLQDRYLSALRPFMKKVLESTTLSSEHMTQVIFRYIISVISVWLAEDFPTPPETFSKIFLNLMQLSPEKLSVLDVSLDNNDSKTSK